MEVDRAWGVVGTASGLEVKGKTGNGGNGAGAEGTGWVLEQLLSPMKNLETFRVQIKKHH